MRELFFVFLNGFIALSSITLIALLVNIEVENIFLSFALVLGFLFLSLIIGGLIRCIDDFL